MIAHATADDYDAAIANVHSLANANRAARIRAYSFPSFDPINASLRLPQDWTSAMGLRSRDFGLMFNKIGNVLETH